MQDKADSDLIAPRTGKRANPKKRKLAEISGEAP
jgi:transposase